MTRRGSFAPPASLDREARTFTATIASSTPVRRPPPSPNGDNVPWDEILAITPQACDLSRLGGAPLLLGHDQTRHIGTITAARIEGGQLVADFRLSRRPEIDPILQDIADGVLVQTSAGYTVQSWRRQPSTTGVPTFVAERWRPLEASALPLGADGEVCRIRAFPTERKEASIMPDIAIDTPEASAPEAAAWTIDDYANLVQSAEKLRVRAAFIDQLRRDGATVDMARRAIIDEAAAQDEAIETRPHRRVEMIRSHDDPQARAERMGEALYCRANPGTEPSPAAREFISMSLSQIAAECLQYRGFSVRGVPAQAIITRALHTTSDFSLTLGDAAGRALKAEYQAAPRGLAQLATTVTASDFRARTLIDIAGDTISLEKVHEAGEYKYATIKEGSNSVRLETFGRIFAISRQAIVNDDLDAFSRLPRVLARSAIAMEDELLASLVESNPTLGDGVALFHSSHGNLAGSGGAISETTLAAGRLAMRLQTGLNGGALGLAPAYLVVAPAAETLAEKTLTAVQAAQVDDANPFSYLRLIVDSRLTGTSWYLVAAPTAAEALIACHLEGNEAPVVESRQGWQIDGLELKVRHDYGCAFTDFRPWYKNGG